VSPARGSSVCCNRLVEKRTTDISARAEWIDRWIERIASAVRLGKIAGRLERRERRDGGSFLLDSRNVSISLIEGLSHGKRVNSIYSRVEGMARWTERKERGRERERERVKGSAEGWTVGATITEMRPITPSPRRHRVSGVRTRG